MGRLILVAAALFLACPAQAQSVDTWSAQISEASHRFGIPEPWIRRVMRAESGGNTRRGGRPIVSRAGAMGLMQLMPATWATVRDRLGLGFDPHQPRDNILAGTFYLRMMYDRFGYPGLFAAYNAGPGRYARHLATGRSLPRETVAYVQGVAGPRALAGASAVTSRTVATSLPHSMPQLTAEASSQTPRTDPRLFVINVAAEGRGNRRRSSLFVPVVSGTGPP